VRVAFLTRKRLQEVPVQALNSPRGSLLTSTPEATAVDLVGYQHRAGGLDQVATVLFKSNRTSSSAAHWLRSSQTRCCMTRSRFAAARRFTSCTS
jgi:hypothetical protein